MHAPDEPLNFLRMWHFNYQVSHAPEFSGVLTYESGPMDYIRTAHAVMNQTWRGARLDDS